MLVWSACIWVPNSGVSRADLCAFNGSRAPNITSKRLNGRFQLLIACGPDYAVETAMPE
jgi:hypothetical protein